MFMGVSFLIVKLNAVLLPILAVTCLGFASNTLLAHEMSADDSSLASANNQSKSALIQPPAGVSEFVDHVPANAPLWHLYPSYISFLDSLPTQVKDRFYFKSSNAFRQIAITFDDGPLANSGNLIALLQDKQVPATLFLVTNQLTRANAPMYQNLAGSDIEVGLHTHTHQDYRKLGQQQKTQDVSMALDVFARFGLESKYFRPAYGVIDKELADILTMQNLTGVLWSLDSHDWNRRAGKQLIDGVLDNLHDGAILLFHDQVSVADVDAIISGALAKKFEFVSLSKLMKNPSYSP